MKVSKKIVINIFINLTKIIYFPPLKPGNNDATSSDDDDSSDEEQRGGARMKETNHKSERSGVDVN